MANVLVVAELLDGKLRRTTHSAVTYARKVAEGTSGAFDILVIGPGAAAGATEAAALGARKVIACEIGGGYVAERYAATVADQAKASGATNVVATASTYGKDLLPRVAAKLGAAVASDISGVAIDGGTIVYKRPMYAGNIIGYVELTTPNHVVTVRQSEFEAASPSGAANPIENRNAVEDPAAARVQYIGIESQKKERPDLSEAAIVVSGGRALGSAENFKKYIEPLADALGAAVGASRAACDAGYVPNDLQVGQTGKVVAPKLYMAFGISGAIQHLAGMKGSKVIVAVNRDKTAPITQVSDYVLVGDLFQVLPELTEAVKKLKAASA